jgi:nicotinamide-nucleotide amidase
MPRPVEIISIGDELLIGQTVNTNASWIGDRLLQIGLRVSWVTVAGDELADVQQALRIAESRADIVLLTGGLGPTHDDVTKKAVSRYFDSGYILNEKVLEQVAARFKNRGIPMADVNREQAMVPEKAEIIENDRGTAPGLVFRRGDKIFVVMPGVPGEMKSMMERLVIPELERSAERAIAVSFLRTTGIPESTLFEKLGDLDAVQKQVQVAFLPSLAGVKIRLLAAAESREEANRRIDAAAGLIRNSIAPYIYAERDISLEQAIVELLQKAGKTLSVAESCTGGSLANSITNISGSSQVFERGVVSYSNTAKMDVLGVPEELINAHGAVSEQVARAMASGVRKRANTDYALSTTGIAGPTGGTAEKPVGLVYIGYADTDTVDCRRYTFVNDRLGNKRRTVSAALDLLRRKICGIDRNNG